MSLAAPPPATLNGQAFRFGIAAARFNQTLVDAVREAAEGQRLEPHASRASERREEQPFAAEERRLDLADVLDVEVDRRRVGHHAAGVHQQGLPGLQFAPHHSAPGMHKGQAIAFELLHDEPLATEEAHRQLLLEVDPQGHAARCADHPRRAGTQPRPHRRPC